MNALGLLLGLLAALPGHPTPEEDALLDEVDQQHFIKARDLAEKVLAQQPDSFAAAWAMARVHHDEEGNHARALAWVRKAEALLPDEDPTWGAKLLLEEYFILAEMNRNEEALQVLDVHEAKYGPPPSFLRIWPLFKSGRGDEARVIATRLSTADDDHERAEGFNGLLAIAAEESDREASYRWALAGVEATGGHDCTLLRNASNSAYVRFRSDEAMELSTRARKLTDCIGPIDNQIASLALVRGEFQQAVAALESSRSTYIEKRYRPHVALERRGVLADLLDVVGQPEEALKIAAELYAQPQRMGISSGPPDSERLSRTMRYDFALDGRIAQLREQASWADGPAELSRALAELAPVMATRWEVRRALVQLLAREGALVAMTRPMQGEADFRTGDLIDVVGSGVMRAALARTRVLDAAFPEATPPLDALEGEIAFREGSLDEAVKLGTAALAGLPPSNALWRWRTLAWRADALRRLGRMTEARADYQEVLQRWPTALRVLGLSVPVKLSHDGSARAKDTASRLGRSSRFEVQAQAPFQLTVSSATAGLEVCLLDDYGAQLACASGEDGSKALAAFHAAAFAPRVSLTQSDLKSLDGSPVRIGADEALRKLLGR